MRRITAMIAALALVFAIGSAPANAVTDGELDGDRHPYVGLMVAQDAKGNPLWRCSGTLLSPTLYLTAGHCTEAPAAHVEIWFTSDLQAVPNSVSGYPFTGDASGTPYTHPQYDPNAFYRYDLGVVVLKKPLKMKAYGKLPELGANSAYAAANQGNTAWYTAVGYGLQKAFPTAADWKESRQRTRMFATPYIIQIDTPWTGPGSILLSNNTNSGGTCFGDSGGPNFIGGSTIVGGVTSFGLNSTCAGTGGVYRVDTSDDLDWLYGAFGSHLR